MFNVHYANRLFVVSIFKSQGDVQYRDVQYSPQVYWDAVSLSFKMNVFSLDPENVTPAEYRGIFQKDSINMNLYALI